MSIKLSAAVLLLAVLSFTVLACTSWQSAATDVNVTGEDIVYLRDERTELCFAVLFLQNKVATKVTQMAMTQVSCESLQGVPTR